MACDIVFDDGSPTLHAWLCDVVRMLDGLDEQASDVAVHEGSRKQYNLAGSRRLLFRDEAVGKAHVFRIAFAHGTIICDDLMRTACKKAQLRCITFIDAIQTVVIIPDRTRT